MDINHWEVYLTRVDFQTDNFKLDFNREKFGKNFLFLLFSVNFETWASEGCQFNL